MQLSGASNSHGNVFVFRFRYRYSVGRSPVPAQRVECIRRGGRVVVGAVWPARATLVRRPLLRTVSSASDRRPLRHAVQVSVGTRRARKGTTGVFPLPNGCMIVNNIVVSGEAILRAENIRKPLGGRGSASNPAGELTALPIPPNLWEGGCCPSLRTPPPLSAFSPSVYWPSPSEESWAGPWLEPGLRVTGQRFWPGRVGSRISVKDPVSDLVFCVVFLLALNVAFGGENTYATLESVRLQ